MARYDIHFGDNLAILGALPDGMASLVYLDPPFNTGHDQTRVELGTTRDPEGDRSGFQGERYRTEILSCTSYGDRFSDYLGFLRPRLEQVRRLLTPDGSLFFHIDYREAHYCKILLDEIFGRASFINEIIWAYDYGGRSRSRWPAKHDTLLWYARDPERYHFDYDAIDRIPYLAPTLVGAEKAARGKTPTDVWWHTIVPPQSYEKTGYPTQKPMGILRRIISVHSRPGDMVLDAFAGSGTTGMAAAELGRDFTLIDSHPAAIAVMKRRFADLPVAYAGCEHIDPAPPRLRVRDDPEPATAVETGAGTVSAAPALPAAADDREGGDPADTTLAVPLPTDPVRPVEPVEARADGLDGGAVPTTRRHRGRPYRQLGPLPSTPFHAAVQRLLEERQWTMVQLAEAIGMTVPTAYRIATGALPQRRTLRTRFEALLGIDAVVMEAMLGQSELLLSHRHQAASPAGALVPSVSVAEAGAAAPTEHGSAGRMPNAAVDHEPTPALAVGEGGALATDAGGSAIEPRLPSAQLPLVSPPAP